MNELQRAVVVAFAPVVLGTQAFAQPETTAPGVPGATTNTPQQRSPANTTTAAPPAAPVNGANSFTMDEARRRIEAGGFSQVTALKKEDDGIWRGQAVRGGTSVPVFCDYQGNVGAS